jgi:hypothetical protein
MTILCSSRDGDHFKLQKVTWRQDGLSQVYPCHSNVTYVTYFTPMCFRYTVPLRSCFAEWRGSSLLHASGDRPGLSVLQYSQEQDLINRCGPLGRRQLSSNAPFADIGSNYSQLRGMVSLYALNNISLSIEESCHVLYVHLYIRVQWFWLFSHFEV